MGLGGHSLSRWENRRGYESRSMDVLLRVAFGVSSVVPYLRWFRVHHGSQHAHRPATRKGE